MANLMLLRPIAKTDLDAIAYLASQAGIGITTFPNDKELLEKRLNWSSCSFEKVINAPQNEYYLFVLEDLNSHQVIGISGIESFAGYGSGFFSYKIHHDDYRPSFKLTSNYETLNFANDYTGCSEICSLFLLPKYRHSGNGILLSKARFLFMANHPQRFSSTIIADMRGISDANGRSPFWNNVGGHFFNMSFAEADYLTTATNKEFILALWPKYPLYTCLLGEEAKLTIGKPHQSSITAMKILLNEGFKHNAHVDIFDAGPTLETLRLKIKTIANSQVLTIKKLKQTVASPPFLLANTTLNFRATISSAEIIPASNTCIISQETASILKLKPLDEIRLCSLVKANN